MAQRAAGGIRRSEGAREVGYLFDEVLSGEDEGELFHPAHVEPWLAWEQAGAGGLQERLDPSGAKKARSHTTIK